jgi:hypothetical protein
MTCKPRMTTISGIKSDVLPKVVLIKAVSESILIMSRDKTLKD